MIYSHILFFCFVACTRQKLGRVSAPKLSGADRKVFRAIARHEGGRERQPLERSAHSQLPAGRVVQAGGASVDAHLEQGRRAQVHFASERLLQSRHWVVQPSRPVRGMLFIRDIVDGVR